MRVGGGARRPGPGAGGPRETPLSHSFCKHVVATSAPLVIEDARQHDLVSGNPAIDDFGVAAYLVYRDATGRDRVTVSVGAALVLVTHDHGLAERFGIPVITADVARDGALNRTLFHQAPAGADARKAAPARLAAAP